MQKDGHLGCDVLQLAQEYGGLGPSELRRLKQLEEEDTKLKRLWLICRSTKQRAGRAHKKL